ncbi:MAG: hypothetical protein U0670_18045 [Anaerolineae bacterium]
MKLLTAQAMLPCTHETGITSNNPSQKWVTIQQSPVLVEPDPVGWTIKGCSNVVMQKPCTTTLRVLAGYSTFIKVNGMAVCLDTLTGITDGTPPGAAYYKVRRPGQDFVQGGS